MRRWILTAACAGCGQMYQAPGGQRQPGPPGPPGASSVSVREQAASQRPGEAYAIEPAAFPQPAAPAVFPQPADPAAIPQPAAPAEPAELPELAEPMDATSDDQRGAKPPRGAAAPRSDAQAFIQAHNRVRAKHCAGPLTWSAKLAGVAQKWANSLRDRGCSFGHSNGAYGENLAAGTTGTLGPEAVVAMWYDEVAHYRFPDGGFSMQTGHFTQVVWRGTTHVGCGRSHCKDMDIWVCEYDPPGNWEGQYRENVLPLSCR